MKFVVIEVNVEIEGMIHHKLCDIAYFYFADPHSHLMLSAL